MPGMWVLGHVCFIGWFKMMKYTCDKCKKEIKNIKDNFRVTITLDPRPFLRLEDEVLHLCKPCYLVMIKWMNA